MANRISRTAIVLIAAILALACLFVGVPKTEAASTPSHLIIINKATNKLAYYQNGSLVRTFSVGTGRTQSLTPEGHFKVVNKIVNRPYYKGNIPGGDPRNPLGNRWLGLNARGTYGTTYAIHGNNNPASIGKYVSSGCVRMYDEEVEWLFSKVTVGTPVVITTSSKSFNDIAAANGYNVSGNSGSTPAPSTGTVLKKGSKGNAVKELQQKLTSLGYNTKGTDGVFGANTDSAVRKFQKDHGLTADGIVGPSTYKALGSSGTKPNPTTPTNPTNPKPTNPPADTTINTKQTLKKGSKGSNVQALQKKLTAIGYNTKGTDGIFGANTEAAVRNFQKDNKLAADGIAGPNTLTAISKR